VCTPITPRWRQNGPFCYTTSFTASALQCIVIGRKNAEIVPSRWGSAPHAISYVVPRAHPSLYPKRYVDRFSCFLDGYRMLCCTMHCQWGRNPPKLPIPLGFRYPAGEGLSHGRRQHAQNNNSSGDEIANVNFFYDDTLHALQNIVRC